MYVPDKHGEHVSRDDIPTVDTNCPVPHFGLRVQSVDPMSVE